MPRYSSTLLDHFDAPRNTARLTSPDLVGQASLNGRAPRVTMEVHLTGDVVHQAAFGAFGCGVTIACCSMLTELITGKTVAECTELDDVQLIEALDGLPADRHHCAALAVRALHDALKGTSADTQHTSEEER